MVPADVVITVEHDKCDFWVHAIWHGHRVGRLWGTLQGTRLQIDDSKVEDSHPAPNRLMHKAFTWLGISPEVISFRGKGVGSRMLDRLIAEAATTGAEEVWGSLVAKDLAFVTRMV